MPKFVFNRYHLISSNKIEDKKEFLLKGIDSRVATKFRDYAYRVIDVTEVEGFIVGSLIKYDPYSVNEVFNDQTGKLSEGGIKNKIVAKALFLINMDESLIIFETVPNWISKQTFTDRFKEIFKDNQDGGMFAEFHISPIKEEYSFIEQVKKMSVVSKLRMHLVPSNPRFRDQWKDVDERLRNNHISKYKEEQESQDIGGLTVDEITESKLMMTEDGYGDSTAYGKDEEGQPVIIRTLNKDKDVQKNIPEATYGMGFHAIIAFIMGTINKIKSRTNKDE